MGDGIKLATGSRRRRQNFGLEHVELGTFKNSEYEFVRDSQKTHDLSHPLPVAREIMVTPPIRIMLNHTPSRMASLSLLGLLISHVFIVTRNCSAFHLPTTPSV